MLVGIDTETHLFRRGYMTPRHVCTTLATGGNGGRSWLMAIMCDVEEAVGPGHIRRSSVSTKSGKFSPAGTDNPPDVDVHTYLLDRAATFDAWPRLLDSGADMVFHNASFDLRVLTNEVPSTTRATLDAVDGGRVWDTAIREKLIAVATYQLKRRMNPFTGKIDNARFNLAWLVMRYFRVDLRPEKTDPMAWRLRYADLERVPVDEWPDDAVEYAVMDALWPLFLLEQQDATCPRDVHGHPTLYGPDDASFPEPDRRTSYPTPTLGRNVQRLCSEVARVRADVSLGAMAAWGIRANRDKVAKLEVEWTRIAAAGKEIGLRGGFIRGPGTRPASKIGTRDLKALRARIGAAFGVPVKVDPEVARGNDLYSEKGALRYGEDVLVSCPDPLLQEYATSLQATSWLSRYLPSMKLACDVPATYGVDSLKATGRVSIYDPPFHQPPREGGYRECFEARDGTVFVLCDYAQAELRALAQIQHWWGLGDGLRRMFLDDADPLADMGAQLLNAEGVAAPDGGQWTYGIIMRAIGGEWGPEVRKTAKDARQLGKVAMYGLPGGLGPASLVRFAQSVYKVTIDLARAEFIRDTWRARPEMGGYLAVIGSMAGDRDRFTIAQCVTARVRGGCTYTSAANGFFQGLVADGFLDAAWSAYRECIANHGTALFGCRPVLPVHDELIIEAPEETAHEAALRLEKVMVAGLARHIPDVPIKAEAALCRFWTKSAEPRTGADGRLQPWEPETRE